MMCPKCHYHRSSLVAHLCPKCGAKLMPLPECIHCGQKIGPNESKCPGCDRPKEAALNPFVHHDNNFWDKILNLFR